MFLRSLSPCCQSCQTLLKTHQHSRFRFLKPAAWRRHNRGRGGGRRRVLARPLWRNSDPKRHKSVRVACFERLKKKKNGMPSLMVCISEMDNQGWIARMFIDTWLLALCVVLECLYFTHCNAMCVVVLFCFCLKMQKKTFFYINICATTNSFICNRGDMWCQHANDTQISGFQKQTSNLFCCKVLTTALPCKTCFTCLRM